MSPCAQVPVSMIHARALGNLVDDLLVGSQSDSHHFRGLWIALGYNGTIRSVMAGREHLLDIKRVAHAALQRPPMHARHCLTVRREHYHRLYGQRVIHVALTVPIGLAYEAGGAPNDTTHQKRGHVQLLPNLQVFTHDDSYFGIEHSSVRLFWIFSRCPRYREIL